jgi:hypothetical protein
MTLGLAALAVLAGATPRAQAQTPDMIFAVGRFVADMSVAGPGCGKRDRAWAVRLAYGYRAALNALPPQIAAQLPDRTVESAWNATLYEMDQARAALRANQAGYCGQRMGGERLGHADALADGTMAFW